VTAAAGLEIAQIELRVAALGPAAAFLRAAFGWWVAPVPGAEEALAGVDTGTMPLARLRVCGPDEAPGLVPWVIVADLAAALAAASALGAETGEVVGIGATGWAAVTRDPWGNRLCLWEPGAPVAPRFSADGSHPAAGVSLPVASLAQAVRYYRGLCGWAFQMSLDVEGLAVSAPREGAVAVALASRGTEEACLQVRTSDLDLAAARVGLARGVVGRPTPRGPRGERVRPVAGPGGLPLALLEAGRAS